MPASDSRLLGLFYGELFRDPLFRDFFGGSGFANLGYWDGDVADGAAAGTRLVERVLGLAPGPRGRLLDVACGEGATTRQLAGEADRITAVNLSLGQLRVTGRRAPGAQKAAMDAVELAFADESFDTVTCFEAAFHFATRERFLAEARRVLVPGGVLLLSDLLMAPGTPLSPPENRLAGARAYRALLCAVGFEEVRVHDERERIWDGFRRAFTRHVLARVRPTTAALAWRDLVACNVACSWAIRHCIVAAARKPG
ncbi:MAG: class I SAM-dependent methyltransferase [Thermoanaerobaculia bacterium]